MCCCAGAPEAGAAANSVQCDGDEGGIAAAAFVPRAAASNAHVHLRLPAAPPPG